MKRVLLLFSIVSSITVKSQTDTTGFYTKYLSRFYTDTGIYLPNTPFIDIDGNKTTLNNHKGKILYVGLWSTSCGSSMFKFPFQEQLLKRLKVMQLDTLVQFVNINTDDTEQDWKKAVKEHKPIGLNLYSSDTALLTKWNIFAVPAYIILDPDGKVLGKDITQPDEPLTIDYLLYSASKGIHPVQALGKLNEQTELMHKNRTSSALTDEDFKKWYNAIISSLIECEAWRKEFLEGRKDH